MTPLILRTADHPRVRPGDIIESERGPVRVVRVRQGVSLTVVHVRAVTWWGRVWEWVKGVAQ